MKIQMKCPLNYYGGKQTLLPTILPLIPQHKRYTEAFAGGAAVFFGKKPSDFEVINDRNKELVNFYETIVNNFAEIKKLISTTLYSRAQHEHAWYIYCNAEFFTPPQRAWAIWCLNKQGFSGQLSQQFGVSIKENGGCRRIAFAKENFTTDLCRRLEHTLLECTDALTVIQKYNSPDTFHFIDPPYVGSNCGHYAGMFDEQDLRKLLNILVNIKGKFMLTMYPHPQLQRFATINNWQITSAYRTLTVSAKIEARRRQEEWLLMNYKK
jgi:DNA adenine methylase